MEEKNNGNTLYMAQKFELAVGAYSDGIKRVLVGGDAVTADDTKSLPFLYGNRSKAYMDLCQLNEAFKDAELAIQANPSYGKAYLRRALVYLDYFKNKEAIQDFDKAQQLEPGLAPPGCDHRLRAIGKKWVPNCYLRLQKAAQKKHHGAHYVALLDAAGSGNDMPLMATTLKPIFAEAYNTGDPLSICKLYRHITTTEYFTKGGDTFKLSDEFKAAATTQLELEFGPIPEGAKKSKAKGVDQTPVTLYNSVVNSSVISNTGAASPDTTTDDDEGRALYPGAPKWMELPNFLEVVNHEWPNRKLTADELKKLAASTLHQRSSDLKVRQQDKMADKCHHCELPFDVTLPDDAAIDPPECGCGEVYCSVSCHRADWPQHKAECKQVGAQDLTAIYWQLVLKGYWPYKEEPNFVAQWKEEEAAKKKSSDSAASSNKNAKTNKAELEFYLQHERTYLQRQMGKVQPGFLAAMKGELNTDPEGKDRAMTAFLEEASLQKNRLTSPLLYDSSARLAFKLTVAEVFHMMQEEAGINLSMPSREEMKRTFMPLIDKARKQELSTTAALPLKSTEAEKVDNKKEVSPASVLPPINLANVKPDLDE